MAGAGAARPGAVRQGSARPANSSSPATAPWSSLPGYRLGQTPLGASRPRSTSSASRITRRQEHGSRRSLYFEGVHFLRKRRGRRLLIGVGENATAVAGALAHGIPAEFRLDRRAFRPMQRLVFSARVDPRLRAPPRPLRVLAARRRLQDRQAGRARRGVRPARARADRSRRHERRRRALQGLQEARHQADPRPRGVLRGRPHGARGQDRAQPPDADRAERRRLPQPRQALQRRASSRGCTAASRAWTWSCWPSTPRASSR